MLPTMLRASLRPLAAAGALAWAQPPRGPGACDGRKPATWVFPATRFAPPVACESHKHPKHVEIESYFDRMIAFSKDIAVEAIPSDLMIAKEDFNKPPMVMFVGAFSAGKSTLINNLMGSQVCATGVTPTTGDLGFHEWQGCLLVDSAGIDALHKPKHKENALEAARRSNMAVVVINARQPLRDSEGEILRELVAANSKVVVALNYWNHLEEEKERQDCLKYVEDMFAQLMPSQRPLIIPMNAKYSDDPGVKQLEAHLQTDSIQDGFQKRISAKAALSRGIRTFLDVLDAEMATWQEKISSKDASIQDLDKDFEIANLQRENLQRDKASSPGFLSSFGEGAATGAWIDAASGGMLLFIPTLVGCVAGAVAGVASQKERNAIHNEILLHDRCHSHLTDKRDALIQEKDQIQETIHKGQQTRRDLKRLLDSVEQM